MFSFQGNRRSKFGLGLRFPTFGRLARAIVTFNLLAVALGFISLSAASKSHTSSDIMARQLASLPFPRHASITDERDVLNEYVDYLKFVQVIGRDVDPSTAKNLQVTFEKLRKRDSRGAARFLRGLRFEMVQKLEFLGASPAQVSTSTPVIRQWVKRYLKEWHREADEYLFRAIAFSGRSRG